MSTLSFKAKCAMALCFDIFGINAILRKQKRKQYNNNFIRVVNYHDTKAEYAKNFEKQLKWYKRHYDNVSYDDFRKFIGGEKKYTDRPGIMLTFDDGFKQNKTVGAKLLHEYGFTGYFFVSSDLVDKDKYMSTDDLKDLIKENHVIGCHTATHHRMDVSDTEETLYKEIVDSKKTLERKTESEITSFCWVGGEEEHYTKEAANKIKSSGYRYSFMTNSEVLTPNTNPLQIQRTNVETFWNMALLRFQLSGYQDKRYKGKRDRVNALTK